MSFGEKLKNLREEKEISQGALGKELNMTQRKISYLENNVYEPSLADIFEICSYFDISADYLVGLRENMPYPKR